MNEPVTPIGRSQAFLDYLDHLSRIAPLARPVLVIGERGTGKEGAASRLHFLSSVWSGPLVKLNCAALPDSLLEDELFGHEAGAFTGAQRRRIGRFELANNGTLFLDEIANAPLAVQEKILRVIEYGELERVGGTETIKVNVRVVGATNADLPKRAQAGKFREDLLDRLAFDVVTLPPLRHRVGDIPLLVDHFGRAMAHEIGRSRYDGFAPSAMALLEAHDWPGNVRQLKNVVERAIAHSQPGKAVSHIALDPFASPYRPVERAEAPVEPSLAATIDAPNISGAAPIDFAATVEGFERKLLTDALAANRHSQRATAEHLNLGYHQLRNLLRKYALLGKDNA